MTYKKLCLQVTNQQDIKKEVIDSVNRNIQETINNMELSISDNSNIYSLTTLPSQDDVYKLCSILNMKEKVVEICDQQNCKLIIGSITDIVDESNNNEICIGKQTYCLCDDKLTEGCLIKVDDRMKCYAMIQTDDIYKASTVGKVIALHDSYVYYDVEYQKRTEGEYEISRAKKLQFNPAGPSVTRRPSLGSVRSIGGLSSQRTPLSQRSTSRTSMTNNGTTTPRSLINKYRLVTYI